MTGFILRALITALGLWLATRLVNGIRIDDATTLDGAREVVRSGRRCGRCGGNSLYGRGGCGCRGWAGRFGDRKSVV